MCLSHNKNKEGNAKHYTSRKGKDTEEVGAANRVVSFFSSTENVSVISEFDLQIMWYKCMRHCFIIIMSTEVDRCDVYPEGIN